MIEENFTAAQDIPLKGAWGSIKYIGVDDLDIDLFESQYIVPEGMSYNSYLIEDEKIAIMDTADRRKGEEWKANLKEALAGRKPDYLVAHHMEPDHASLIAEVLEAYPELKLVCSAQALKMLPNFFDGFPFEGRVLTVKEGDFTYQLKTKAKDTIYRFVVRPNGSRVRLASETPGQGFVATSRVHWLTGAGQDLYFQARKGAGDVKVELTMSPGEWVSAELIDPAGAVVDKCVKANAGVILNGKRAADAPSEIWRLHVTRFIDDCKIRLGAATSGVYAYDPELLLVERGETLCNR